MYFALFDPKRASLALNGQWKIATAWQSPRTTKRILINDFQSTPSSLLYSAKKIHISFSVFCSPLAKQTKELNESQYREYCPNKL